MNKFVRVDTKTIQSISDDYKKIIADLHTNRFNYETENYDDRKKVKAAIKELSERQRVLKRALGEKHLDRNKTVFYDAESAKFY